MDVVLPTSLAVSEAEVVDWQFDEGATVRAGEPLWREASNAVCVTARPSLREASRG